MLWRARNNNGDKLVPFLPGTAYGQVTALLLYAGALPVAAALSLFIDWRAFILYTLMWPVGLLRRNWKRTALILFLIVANFYLLAQLVRPPQAPFFMLMVLVLAAAEQVQEDGRPGAFNLIGVIFPALCVMVLSSNVFVFLLLLVSVIFYTGVYTLRINDMPLSGLRIRLLPIIVALSGSLFFAIAAFILMPRINPSAIPGFQQEEASSGVGDELDMGRFSDVILNGEDAFRAFLPAPLPQSDLYWRVHVLTQMQGARWLRAPTADLFRGLPPFTGTLGNVRRPIDVTIRHAEAAPDWHPVLGVPLVSSVDAESRLNPEGEFVKRRRVSVLEQQVSMRTALDNPFNVYLDSLPLISGQPRLSAWAQETYARAGSREAFVMQIMRRFSANGYGYTLSPPKLDGDDKIDRFFFDTKRGYCSHYAMAMAAALRAAGIPANVIIGYHGGEWNSYGNYYRVRQSDAHAWVEVEMAPGQWQRFDPTQIVPDAQAQFASRQIAATTIEQQEGWRGELARNLQRLDAFIVRINSDIVLYDEQARQELLEGTVLGRLVSFGTFWLFGTLAFIAPLLLVRWYMRRDPFVRLDQKFFALAKKYGVERPLHEGRMDFAARWQSQVPALAKPIGESATLICDMLFSGRALDKAEQAALRRQLAQQLTQIARYKSNKLETET